MPRRPLEVLNLAAVAVLFLLTCIGAALNRLPGWGALAGGLALLGTFVALMGALGRREERLPRALRLAVNFYPMAAIPLLYETLGSLIPAIHPVERDAWLAAADRALLGVDPTVWLERFLWPPLTDLLLLAYCSYYFFPIIVGVLLWRRDPEAARRFIFGLTLAFYVSYLGYFLVPARGPRVELASLQTVPVATTPFSRAITTTLDRLENTKNDAFPSGHTMITVFCLLVARRRLRRLFRAWLPVAALLVVSTVYCRYHYVADVLAGLGLAFAALPLADRLYDRLYDWLCAGAEVPAGRTLPV